jgi:hypothetical protein
MLNYVKLILSKVSFDRSLFEKELKKAIVMLIPIEVLELKQWCVENFGHIYSLIINRCFVRAGF